MRKGQIVLVPFPFTDLYGQKVRPALVLYSGAQDCMLAFISSIREKSGMFTVHIGVNAKNGLKLDSYVRLNKLATLHKNVVLGVLGSLDAATMLAVNAKLKRLFVLS